MIWHSWWEEEAKGLVALKSPNKVSMEGGGKQGDMCTCICFLLSNPTAFEHALYSPNKVAMAFAHVHVHAHSGLALPCLND